MVAHWSQAKITVVWTSHFRRLKDAIYNNKDPCLEANFGLDQAEVTLIWKEGWTLSDIARGQDCIDQTQPDYIILLAGSYDTASVPQIDSIKIANDLLELAQ